MKKSTHRVEIVKLDPFKHPNADSLSIQKVFGYQVVLRTEDWVGVEYGAYLVPDSVVDTQRPEFSWLAPGENPNFRAASEGDTRYHRVTCMRLRGVVSYGLMIPAPEGMQVGEDASDLLGVTRYQPMLLTEGQTDAPDGYHPEYDLEAFERYAGEIFEEGETVVVKEKLDGVNARFCFLDGELHVGSKSIWLDGSKVSANSPWFSLDLTTWDRIVNLCADQNATVYGEIIGYPKGLNTKLRYGHEPGGLSFYVFDILRGSVFDDDGRVGELCTLYKLNQVPEVARLEYNFEKVQALVSGPSLVPGAKHNREGIVIRSEMERQELVGRAALKMVSPKALMG